MKISKTLLMKLAIVAVAAAMLLAACGGGGTGGATTQAPAATTAAPATTAAAAVTEAAAEEKAEPADAKEENMGRPYNLEPVKYDNRLDIYLNSINATKLPIVEEPITLTVWESFSSTVIQDLGESEVYQELERRTNVKLEWMYPPKGQEKDNFSLLTASGDLPDIFVRPPAYPGGPAKAIEDGIFAELTPYYDKGYMPNIKWIREHRADINRDWVDDDGRFLAFIMLDIVPSSPWSGLWIRQDWLDELGLDLPKTIDDWEDMLYKMKDAKDLAPLSLNVKDWYGVSTNYEFAGSYETGYNFIRRDGKTVEYGPINDGYIKFLTLMNKWYADGIIDPDFATRTYDDYISNIIEGKYGAFGMAYGDVGPLKLGGTAKDPKFKMTPMLAPLAEQGQTIHLHQTDSTVRAARDYMTTTAEEKGLAEIICRYEDYRYSQDGGDLCSYGPLNVSYVWNSDGVFEWIYPTLSATPDADFWTLYPKFKLHEGSYLRDSTSYKNEQEVWDCIDLWASQDASWVMPDNMTMTPDEASEIATIRTDIDTYREEMTLKFITGQTPLSEFDNYVKQIKSMNSDKMIEIQQASLDRYLERK